MSRFGIDLDNPDDLTAPIFDNMYIYPCVVPYICTLNKSDVEEFGLRTTSVEELDAGLDTMPVKVWLTINNMVEIFREYYPISIPDTKVAATVYNAITTYTAHWKNYVQSESLNKSNIPAEDLVLMEEFAARIRPIAVDGVSREIIRKDLVTIFDNLFAEPPPSTKHDTTILDFFKEYNGRMG